MQAYQILARKYRPQTFDEVVGQRTVVQTLRNALDSGRLAQAYIFSGMRGVGKTTVARILAKALNCVHGPTSNPCNVCPSCVAIREDRSVDVLEIDGASNRKVEEIGPIRDTAQVKPLQSRFKVIIIDEVHMLSTTAFNALLKTLEEPPASTVFIFATTEFHKVPATIVSRCQHFEFRRLSPKDIQDHLLFIAEKEKIALSRFGAQLIAEAADGSLRDAESLLDKAVAFGGPEVKEEQLKEILGLVPRETLYEASQIILEGKTEKVFTFIHKILTQGYDLRLFYEQVVQHFRNLLLIKTLQTDTELLSQTPEELRYLEREAEKASAIDLLRYLQTLLQAEAGLKYTSHPQIYLETLFIKLSHLPHLVSLKEIFSSLEEGKVRTFLETSSFSPVESSLSTTKVNVKAESTTRPPLETKPGLAEEVVLAESTVGKTPGYGEIKAPTTFLGAEEKQDKKEDGEETRSGFPEKGRPRTKLDLTEKEAVLSNPTIQTFMSLFQARVVSIDSIPKPENTEEV